MNLHSSEYLFCKNVAYIRLVKGLSQKEMAQILGVGVGTLRKIELLDPTVRLTATMVFRISNSFRISSDALLRTDLSQNETNS